MLFAEIFADPLTAAVYVYGTIAAFAMCVAAAFALLRYVPVQQIAGRGEYWLRYRPAHARRRAAFAFLTRPFLSRP
jgi:hypothetical protein